METLQEPVCVWMEGAHTEWWANLNLFLVNETKLLRCILHTHIHNQLTVEFTTSSIAHTIHTIYTHTKVRHSTVFPSNSYNLNNNKYDSNRIETSEQTQSARACHNDVKGVPVIQLELRCTNRLQLTQCDDKRRLKIRQIPRWVCDKIGIDNLKITTDPNNRT